MQLNITASRYEQKALMAPAAVTWPGTLAEKLSRWASHHGAIFALNAEVLTKAGQSRRMIICPGITDLSRAGITELVKG